jgi:hypothetical protein
LRGRCLKLRLKLEFMLALIHDRLGCARAPLRTLLGVCLVVGTAGWVSAASSSTQHSPSSSGGFNSNFAIADFDGDRRPDLATVEVEKGSSAGRTQYSIRLQLTVGATQVFGVIAPAGGLQIVAKDVNGDDALDVVVSTAWQHKQVAVLLNDGHGKFTMADPAAFPADFWGSGRDWSSETLPLCDSTVLVRIEYPAGECDRDSKFDGLQVQFESAQAPGSMSSTSLSLFSLLGRAPPAFIFQS